MKYFYDCEFIEGGQKLRKTFLDALLSTKLYTEPTIDLISIGFVCEDKREYYAISKDFNLDEAWSRDWLRENVLSEIYNELADHHIKGEFNTYKHFHFSKPTSSRRRLEFNYKNLKWLISQYGKSNRQIAQEIKDFVAKGDDYTSVTVDPKLSDKYGFPVCDYNYKENAIKFYGYYSDYDHVCLSWLYGTMMDLPKGFPMYTIDLKQTFDELNNPYKDLSNHSLYPKQFNEHSALEDAKWNKKLYEFLETMKLDI